MKLLEAFVSGKRVIAKFQPWYDIKPALISNQQQVDLHAEILAYLLDHLPKSHNLKLRMDAIQRMADDITDIAQKGKP